MSFIERADVISRLKFSMMLFRSLSTRLFSFEFAKIRISHCIINFKIQLLSRSNFKQSWKNCSVLQTIVTTPVCFLGAILFLICPVLLFLR